MLGYKSLIFGLGLFFVLIFNAHGQCSLTYTHACNKAGCDRLTDHYRSVCSGNPVCWSGWGCWKPCLDCIREGCDDNCDCKPKGSKGCSCPGCNSDDWCSS